MLTKVISGGQTGVDQAALFAAKDIGLSTGGSMPRGFRTLEGNRPEFAKKFGMQEHSSYEYGPRTERNVIDSDGTIRIAEMFSSPGERCTLRYIKKHNKPYLDIQVTLNKVLYIPQINIEYTEKIKDFVKEHNIQILNVAGNSESTSVGIRKAAHQFLVVTLSFILQD